jgi:hypothetical protein
MIDSSGVRRPNNSTEQKMGRHPTTRGNFENSGPERGSIVETVTQISTAKEVSSRLAFDPMFIKALGVDPR